jgi:hypothetical protein
MSFLVMAARGDMMVSVKLALAERTFMELPEAVRTITKLDTSGNSPLSGVWACYPACVQWIWRFRV